MKKRFSIIALSTIILSTLAGCGKSDKIVVTIGMWPESQQLRDRAMFQKWKERFELDYPKYEVVGEPYTYTTDTIHAKAQTNKLPTVFQTWFTEPPMLVNAKYVKDITEPLKELGWYDDIDPSMRETLTFDNKIYGIPRDGYGLGLFMNLKLLEDYGLLDDLDNDGVVDIYDGEGKPLYPTTFDELYEMAEEITYLSGGVTKGLLILTANRQGGWQFSNIAWNFGAELQKEVNGKWVGTLNDPKAIEAMEWIRSMKQNDLVPEGVTFTYGDWFTKVVEASAMAIVGNDVISSAVTQGGINRNDIAFVPMPSGPYGDQYSLFGGTPYVFAAGASDEQTLGAIRFLEYMGRSPKVSEAALAALEEGNQVSVEKNTPILPTIKPWINEKYLNEMANLEKKFVNVNMLYFQDFFDQINDVRHQEVPYYAQEMYQILDQVLQAVFTNPDTVNVEAQLTTANATFNNQFMSKL